MWPIVRRFGLLALGVVAAWLVTVLVLNLTVFSAGGHVLSYLRAMESGDYAIAATKATGNLRFSITFYHQRTLSLTVPQNYWLRLHPMYSCTSPALCPTQRNHQ